MSDLFQDAVPDAYAAAVAEIMLATPWHTYQVLTKRSNRLQELLHGILHRAATAPHIWWGVSVEDRRHGVPRIEHLRQSLAAIRFLSIEPLLEDLGTLDLSGIHWVIVGGESGPGARSMKREWVEAVRKQCEAANVLFFFKQWGGVRKSKHGRLLNGRTYDAMPSQSGMPVPSPEVRARLVCSLAPLVEQWTVVTRIDIEQQYVVA